MNRREFLTLLGGAAATWPLVARAQQAAVPQRRSARALCNKRRRFPGRPKDAGYIEGQSVKIEYRWAEPI